ncbi:MAG TPA: protein kinase [Thermoanaerobaculia bacterium]|nr:protein kinase [Thermoanaerobaculia bacterium]
MIGSRLGHFQVTAKLGEGGMGEVYRAEDTRLGREVAIKVLPPAFLADPERLARFEREARVLASLSHPNIAGIYEVGREGETRFLVMELAPGETLAGRIARGPIPLDAALHIALQVCRALEAAHERGIVHRDLKPANVVVDARGQVKVLDFGLAKALEGEREARTATELAHSPTLTFQATAAGMLLGTAAYMSPEQARGETADRRSDVWSFGVVLWEMLSGRRLFAGRTVSDTLAGILRDEIPLSALPMSTPPALVGLLRRCMQRDVDRRLHDVADARIVIQDLVEGVGEGAVAHPAPPAPARRAGLTAVWLGAALLLALAAAVAGYLLGRPAAAPREPMRLSIQLAPHQEVATSGNATLAFAPDGRSVVLVGKERGQRMLLRRFLDAERAQPITGTEDGEGPFFSPDGRWLGFAAGGRLRKVAAEGGRPFDLAESRGAGGAAWLPDDTLVFAPIYSDGLFRVSAAGGAAERLTTPDRADGQLGHWWPHPLPGNPTRYVLFTAFRTPVDRSRIGVLDLDTRAIRWLVDGGFFGRYVDGGHLLYAKGQRLFAVPFDLATLGVAGPAVDVLDDLSVSQVAGHAMIDVSPQGTLVYLTESVGNPLRELIWLDRDGRATLASDEHRRYGSVSLSPDGRHAALTIQQESADLWTYSFERGTLSRLTSGPDTEFDPVWSRDGRELVYVVDRPPFELHRIAAGAPDSGRPVWEERTERDTTGATVSPDGRTLVFVLTEPESGANLYSRPLDGSEPARPFRTSRASESNPRFSPDGRWLAYSSDETGRPEIYVEAFPGPGERFQVSGDGGYEPEWAASGELFFRHRDELRVVATRLAGGFEFDPPRTLFPFPVTGGGSGDSRSYDVTADGQRVLGIRIPETSVPRRLEVVTDWTEDLARLAPTAAQRR